MSAVHTAPGSGPVDETARRVDEAGRVDEGRPDDIGQGGADPQRRPAGAVQGTSSSARPQVVWRHTDRDLNGALRTALAARNYRLSPEGSALKTEDRVRILRSLVIASLWTAESCRTTGMVQVGEMDNALQLGGEMRADLFPSWGHCYAAGTLGRTLMLFPDPGAHWVYSAETEGGLPAKIDEKGPRMALSGEEAGALPAVAVTVVLVVAVAALGLAACYAAEVAGQVVDRKLTEDALMVMDPSFRSGYEEWSEKQRMFKNQKIHTDSEDPNVYTHNLLDSREKRKRRMRDPNATARELETCRAEAAAKRNAEAGPVHY
jgi:hypothetical protein